MSTIAIPQRNAGDTILASFFNDLRAKWIGDVVGFDVNGNPTSGNNLGNPAYPFGTLYATAAVIGGVPFSTSTLERPPYQIVSGKTRSGSNQPAFLSPAGSSPSFSLLASATNLQLVIKGVSSTWTLDKNSIPVTTAPSTGNTCAVNDATAAAQAATRTWGEYGSGSPYYAITVSGMGASISARVGSFQAFKVGTEYFVAFVESTTSLSRAFRGYFFDSSGNPIKRATFSNAATITLMNLGFVFADQDGTTVDTIFVGAGVNNAPTYGFTAPSSPATGDYWYDQGNTVWKRWSGAAWLVVNRILVGLVVADGTNCVAARSFDFFGLCRSDNTIELAWSSNTVVKGAGLLERVNVNGNNVYFSSSRAVWDTAANLAASTDRYNSTVQASTTEYFYVTDQGDTKISDVEPYWRPDLFGWYHPFNPWRQVGSDVTDGSANFQSGSVVSRGAIPIAKNSLPPVGQQVASDNGPQTVGSGTWKDVTGTVSLNTTGRPVLLVFQPDANAPSGGGGNLAAALNVGQSSSGVTMFVQLLDGATVLAEWEFGVAATNTTFGTGGAGMSVPGCLTFIHRNAAAGPHSYKIQMQAGTSNSYSTQCNCELVAFEL